MRSHLRRSATKTVIFCLVLLNAIAGVAAAQERGVQPSLHIVMSSEESGLSETEISVQRAVVAAVEARLSAQRRYRISKSYSDLDPDDFIARRDVPSDDVLLFIRLSQRLDGSVRAEFDVYADGAFVRSGEVPVKNDADLFPSVDAFAADAASAVASVFSGFGRLRFTNTGFPHNFYVYVDGEFLGANITEIELPIGGYSIEIRRRDDGFSHVVGRRSVQLQHDDYLEIAFSMAQNAPPVPGFMRLTNPSERWRGIVTFRGAGMIPMQGFEDATNDGAWATAATVLFGHVPFRGLVTGVETEYLRWKGILDGDALSGDPDVHMDIRANSVLAVLGVTVGPVSGVDFIARVGGGVSMYHARAETELGDEEFDQEDIDPAFNGAVEFGFGFGKYGRISLQTALFGVYSDGDVHSWLQLGIGVGGRF